MIESIETVDAAKTPVAWWHKSSRLQRTLEFGPTLNVLVGPNGSGKSTLITALSRLFHCEQGEVPVVTHESLRHVPDDLGLKIGHDGHPVFCLSTEKPPGLIGGMAGFDDDFYGEGVASLMRMKFSHGEQSLIRLPEFMKKIVQVKKVDWRLGKHPGDSAAFRKAEAVKAFLTARTSRQDWKRGTVLLDEPESGLSLPMQVQMWKLIDMLTTRFQVIVATQSPLAFAQPHALFIEMEDGFVQACRRTIVAAYEPLFFPEPKG